MATGTAVPPWSMSIYSIFVRQYGRNGTLQDVIDDLDRIADLGVSHIWLLPIHEIGRRRRKGGRGSPYAIRDYRSVDASIGTVDDVRTLVSAAHARKIGVLMDCVYNHTAADSTLSARRPEWFYRDFVGSPAPRFPEWSDVVDLDYFEDDQRTPKQELWDELIGNLVFWTRDVGVDGFRCDVAAAVPVDFWREARARVDGANSGRRIVWLAESADAGFLREARKKFAIASDAQLYENAFDVCYDYDLYKVWASCFRGEGQPSRTALLFDLLRNQEAALGASWVKMRFVDNHDQERIAALTGSLHKADAWTCLVAFLRGALLIYQGHESGETVTQSLFEVEPVQWGDLGRSELVRAVCALKRDKVVTCGSAEYIAAEPFACVLRSFGGEHLLGVFDVHEERSGDMLVPLPDGAYANVFGGGSLFVVDGKLRVRHDDLVHAAAVLRYTGELDVKPLPGFFA